jgi:hypothetical protein
MTYGAFLIELLKCTIIDYTRIWIYTALIMFKISVFCIWSIVKNAFRALVRNRGFERKRIDCSLF